MAIGFRAFLDFECPDPALVDAAQKQLESESGKDSEKKPEAEAVKDEAKAAPEAPAKTE